MKRIIITVVLIAVCVTTSVAGLYYVGGTADRFTEEIEKVDALAMKNEFVTAAEKCKNLTRDWNSTAKFLDTLLIHDYVDSIGINLSQMLEHLKNVNPDMYFASSAAAKKGLASIKGSEYPEIDNIF